MVCISKWPKCRYCVFTLGAEVGGYSHLNANNNTKVRGIRVLKQLWESTPQNVWTFKWVTLITYLSGNRMTFVILPLFGFLWYLDLWINSLDIHNLHYILFVQPCTQRHFRLQYDLGRNEVFYALTCSY